MGSDLLYEYENHMRDTFPKLEGRNKKMKKALKEILAIANSIRANYSTTDIDYSMGVDSRIEDIELLAKEALDENA